MKAWFGCSDPEFPTKFIGRCRLHSLKQRPDIYCISWREFAPKKPRITPSCEWDFLWRELDLGSKRLIFTRFSLFLKEDFYRHYHWLDYSGKIRIFMEEADQCRLSPFLFSFSCKRGWSWCSKVKLRDLYANSQLKSVTANARPSSLLPQDLLELYCDRLFVFGIIRFIVMKGRGYGWWQ